MRTTVHFIPVLTTLLASVFTVVLLRRWQSRRTGPHLLWWALGAATFAAGTITESLTTVFGWNETVFRWWYVTGALLGGAPLAQGSVYLLMPRKVAHVIFLVGGAFWSAYRYAGIPAKRHRAVGNFFIAVGALLPGIGGTFTRFGLVEVLYVTEFVGLALIVFGFHHITAHPSENVPASLPLAA